MKHIKKLFLFIFIFVLIIYEGHYVCADTDENNTAKNVDENNLKENNVEQGKNEKENSKELAEDEDDEDYSDEFKVDEAESSEDASKKNSNKKLTKNNCECIYGTFCAKNDKKKSCGENGCFMSSLANMSEEEFLEMLSDAALELEKFLKIEPKKQQNGADKKNYENMLSQFNAYMSSALNDSLVKHMANFNTDFTSQFQAAAKNQVEITHPDNNKCLFLIKWNSAINPENIHVDIDTSSNTFIVKYSYTETDENSTKSNSSVIRKKINRSCDTSKNAILKKEASYAVTNGNNGETYLHVWFPNKKDNTTQEDDDDDEMENEYVETTTQQTVVGQDGKNKTVQKRTIKKFLSNPFSIAQNMGKLKNIPPKNEENISSEKSVEEN